MKRSYHDGSIHGLDYSDTAFEGLAYLGDDHEAFISIWKRLEVPAHSLMDLYGAFVTIFDPCGHQWGECDLPPKIPPTEASAQIYPTIKVQSDAS